ncbi:MAG: LysM peptidoglycan-binding domain-containing protein, partial [Candidatus Omnitrophica bacterium]|nr:LysM peptidoglycan-binding domain-containing protein [Candidatus Omnitrophota bacterium]
MRRKFFIALLLIVIAILIITLLRLKDFHPFVKLSSPSKSRLLNLAKTQEENKEYLLAKETYQKLIKHYPHSASVSNWQRHIEEINIKLLFSPLIHPGSMIYEVKPGDTLAKIAKEFNTTVDLIMKSNNLESSNIRPGQKIKVVTCPFSVIVDKSQNILMLKTGDEIIKTYIVSTG